MPGAGDGVEGSERVMLILSPWLTRVIALVLRLLSFGLIRLDVPRIDHIPRMHFLRRWLMIFRARFHGRRDGRLGMPKAHEELAPPEVWKLKQHGDAWVRHIAARWAATEARLVGEREAMTKAIAAIETSIGQRRCELQERVEQHEQRRARLQQKRDEEEGRPVDDRWRISSWFYWPAIMLVFAGEFPLNAVAFNLFGDNRWATYAMTTGMAAVLVFCAHSFGVLSRLKTLSDRDYAVTIVVGSMPVLVTVAIGIVREKYLQALGSVGAGLAILGSVTGVLIFVTMNLMIYVGAFVLSYLHHDPDGELIDRLGREVRRAERAVARKQRAIDGLENTRRWLEGKLAVWEAGREQAIRSAVLQARRHKDFFEAAMEAYWGSNRVALFRAWRRLTRRQRRRGNALPPEPVWPPRCIDAMPEIVLADVFQPEFRPEMLLEKVKATRANGTRKRSLRRKGRTAQAAEPAAAADGAAAAEATPA